MRCQFPNPDDLLDGTCKNTAEWIVVLSTLGYPKNEAVQQPQKRYCPMHVIAATTGAVSDYRRLTAGIQMLRIEHAESFKEVERARGRIGW